MIPQETVDKILDTAQIVEVVSDFVSLRRRGADYVACCPFHNEKTPSFHVSPTKGIFKCFGCGESGTAVGFVMKHENMSYVEALRYLADKYGIEVHEKEETAEDIAARQRRESLLLVMDYTQEFFKASLKTEEGRAVGYRYFKSRGLEDSTIEKYGLGWSPSGGRTLTNDALAKGYKEEFLLAAGVCIKRNDGTLSDKFYDRVIFPIHSVSGRVIAFGGRTLRSDYKEAGIGKYVNSPETEIYDKSNSLYGIYFAKGEISRKDKCFLVEGYLDVLSMHQLGITNVVASSGTSLTTPQVWLIKKFTDNITIMYDGDAAGIHAALRGIGLVLKENMNVRIVLIPDGDDPDSYSRKHTLDEVQAFIDANEKDFISYKTDLLLSQTGGDPIKKASLINDIADTIALIPDQIKRAVYVQYAASRFGIDEQVIYSRITTTRLGMLDEVRKAEERNRRKEGQLSSGDASTVAQTQDSPTAATRAGIENSVIAPAEKDLIGLILNYGLFPLEFESDSEYYDSESTPLVADFIRTAIGENGFENSIYARISKAYFALYDSSDYISNDEILRKLMDEPDREVADTVASLVDNKYMITVKNFTASMTALPSYLVMTVPKAILVYNSMKVKMKEMDITSRLSSLRRCDQTEDVVNEQFALLRELQATAQLRKRIIQRLGRVQ